MILNLYLSAIFTTESFPNLTSRYMNADSPPFQKITIRDANSICLFIETLVKTQNMPYILWLN